MEKPDKDLDALFEAFYTANFPRVKNFAKLLTKSEQDAEDISQSIFMKLWIRPELWQDPEAMTGYLYTMTRNEIFKLFKHQKVEREFEEKVMSSKLIGELSEEGCAFPLEDIYYKEKLMLLNMALSRIPERRRRVFEMSRFDGLSNKEIADRMQMPLRTVEDNIYRTLAELRKLLIFVIIFRIFP
ncbi:RNA polymerase sigma-70 factor [uncultured Muribaculum sp.]|uniref:RNA polymerase sigma-70 factor n=1 Tax=uncultured Muribaculum sp. TaxID=1918613 RepID=UPI0025FF471C|nr:RNA polymerase sigma-70 factor [uncultured Muribaculum sp.]